VFTGANDARLRLYLRQTGLTGPCTSIGSSLNTCANMVMPAMTDIRLVSCQVVNRITQKAADGFGRNFRYGLLLKRGKHDYTVGTGFLQVLETGKSRGFGLIREIQGK